MMYNNCSTLKTNKTFFWSISKISKEKMNYGFCKPEVIFLDYNLTHKLTQINIDIYALSISGKGNTQTASATSHLFAM